MVKNLPANTGDARDTGLIPGLGRFPGISMATHSSRLAVELLCYMVYSPWGRKESDTT